MVCGAPPKFNPSKEASVQTPPGPQSEESILVQFWPCGHTETMTHSKLLEQLGAEQYDQFID